MDINVVNMYFYVVYRVGKVWFVISDGEKVILCLVIVCFFFRGDKDKVMSKKNKLKNLEKYKDVYIINDYVRVI